MFSLRNDQDQREPLARQDALALGLLGLGAVGAAAVALWPRQATVSVTLTAPPCPGAASAEAVPIAGATVALRRGDDRVADVTDESGVVTLRATAGRWQLFVHSADGTDLTGELAAAAGGAVPEVDVPAGGLALPLQLVNNPACPPSATG